MGRPQNKQMQKSMVGNAGFKRSVANKNIIEKRCTPNTQIPPHPQLAKDYPDAVESWCERSIAAKLNEDPC